MTGALALGTVTSSPAAAKQGGTGFISSNRRHKRGDAFYFIREVDTFKDTEVDCEANGQSRSIYTKYLITDPSAGIGYYLWVKGQATVAERRPDNLYRIQQIRDCGDLTLAGTSRSFSVDKITFRPAKQ